MSNKDAPADDFFITIGKVVHNTASAELFMLKAFQVLTKTTNQTASAVFYTLDSFTSKRTLLRRVAKAVGDEIDVQLIEQIASGVEKSNNQRQSITHNIVTFKIPDITSVANRLNPKSNVHEPISTHFLADILRHSGDGLQQAHDALELLCQKHGVPSLIALK